MKICHFKIELVLPLILLLVFVSCNERREKNSNMEEEETGALRDTIGDNIEKDEEWLTYNNDTFNFAFDYPSSWDVHKNKTKNLAAFSVSSVTDTLDAARFNIHAPASHSQIIFFPDGLGTELPAGTYKRFKDISAKPPVNFSLDLQRSGVFLLSNGKVWAYFLRPEIAPPGWRANGFIFAQVRVDSFSVKCFDKITGIEKTMQQCNALMGDSLSRYGTLAAEKAVKIDKILQSLHFFEGKINKDDIKNLISVTTPEINETIVSPLTIKGKARGSWFFEGSFPIELHDSDHNLVATAIATAQGEWMTEGFVPFEATLTFGETTGDSGFLIFKKSNASGLPQHDRAYSLPVRFK